MEQSKFYQIKNVTEHEYTLVGCDGSVITRPIQDIDKTASAFTIQDAKDGDVLINWNNTTFIFKAIEDETVKFHIAYNENWDAIKTPSNKLSHLGLPEPQFEFHPATKEQRNQLEKAMADAGYTFDFEKKELKEIEPDEWSEECCINQLIVFCENCMVQDTNAKRCANFLKSLKERYTWRPSDEQMESLNRAQAELCSTEYNKPICDLIDTLNKLKG